MYRYSYAHVHYLLSHYDDLEEGILPDDGERLQFLPPERFGPRSPSLAAEIKDDLDRAIAHLSGFESTVIATYLKLVRSKVSASVQLVMLELQSGRTRTFGAFNSAVSLMVDYLNGDPPGTERASYQGSHQAELAQWRAGRARAK